LAREQVAMTTISAGRGVETLVAIVHRCLDCGIVDVYIEWDFTVASHDSDDGPR
jgi:hypothetical protein